VSTVVLDVSVAMKWVLPSADENLVPEAIQLLRRYAGGDIRFVVPDIFWAEFGNVAWKAMRLGRGPAAAASPAIREMAYRNFPTVSSRDLLPEAFAIATAFDRTVYDCLYVALAIATQSELVTADEKLANALAASFPVKWLGAF
jgi:predicted nucleic acid-binding protein